MVYILTKNRAGKYCNGILLMAPLFVASVPSAEFTSYGTNSTHFKLWPVFRIAKCFGICDMWPQLNWPWFR